MAQFVDRTVYVVGGSRVEIHSSDLTAYKTLLETRDRQFSNLQQPLDAFGRFLVDVHIPHQINAGGTPQAFAPLSPTYAAMKNRIAPGLPILVRSHRMQQSFIWNASYNDLHIVGDQVAKWHMHGTSKMPIRKWLQLQDDNFGWEKLRDLLREYLRRAGGEM